MNVIVRLVFDLIYLEAVVQQINHYATGTLSAIVSMNKRL